MVTKDLFYAAKSAKFALATASSETKNKALNLMAEELILSKNKIIAANKLDTGLAKGKIESVMLDRLMLDERRIDEMADGIRKTAALPDPVGRVISENVMPNGLVIKKVGVPIGVIGVIFESRPNVTSDVAALAVKSGNTCVMRCGKEAFNTSNMITAALQHGLQRAGLPAAAVQLVQDTTRESATEMMRAQGYIDLLIPRGGAGLIKSCLENATVPCIQTGTGICHIYVDADADRKKAIAIVLNAKTSRPSVCNAAEVCLVDRKIAAEFLPELVAALTTEREKSGEIPVKLVCGREAYSYIGKYGNAYASPAGEHDFDTEFLDYKMAIGVLGGVGEAVEHIMLHSTGHSEAIITENEATAAYFTANVDSAAVYVNASTRFTDGGEFGLGCEIGISTQKLHARGPMGLCELTSYKYVVKGDGQCR